LKDLLLYSFLALLVLLSLCTLTGGGKPLAQTAESAEFLLSALDLLPALGHAAPGILSRVLGIARLLLGIGRRFRVPCSTEGLVKSKDRQTALSFLRLVLSTTRVYGAHDSS
jgi:hypothetical protein